MFENHAVLDVVGMALLIAAQSAIIFLLLAQRRNMAKQKRVEDVLRFQKALLESQSEAAPDGILAVSPEGRILLYNQRFIDMWHIPADVVEARADKNVLQLAAERVAAPDDFLARVHHLYANPEKEDRDEIVLKSGRVFERYSTPIASHEGAMYGRIWFFRDITDRKHRETELKEWIQRYDLIVAASGQVAYDYDVPTGAILWGHTIEGVLGYPLSEISQGFQQWADLLHPDDREHTLKTLDAAEASCSFWDAEYRMRHKDGRYVWIRDRGFFLPDAAGKAVRQLGMLEDITDRKQTESALRESETKFRTIFEKAPTAIAITRVSDGILLEVNPKFEELSGRSRADVVGQSFRVSAQFVNPADVDRIEQEFAHTGKVDNYHLRVFNRAGGIRHELVTVLPIAWGDEECTVSLVSNITALKQAEETLRDSEERLRSFIEQTSEGVTIIDEDGRVIEWNSASERMSGFPRQDVLGRYYWDVANLAIPREQRTPERYAQLEQKIREALRTGQPVLTGMTEYEYERADGERRISQQVIFPIKTTRGYRFGSLSHDVTERKRAEEELRHYREHLEQLVEDRTIELQHEIDAHERTEQALRENEANLMSLIENTDSMIWSIDRNYRLIVGNAVFHETRKLAEGTEYIKGDPVITEAVPRVFRELWYGYYDRALNGERFTCEERRQFPHAGDWWEFRLSPIQSVSGEILGATVLGRNITANKQAEADLRKAKETALEAKERAEVAQRASESANQAKSIFLSNMSHELRTPLNAILGFAQILARETTLSPEQREFIETINRSGEHLLKLINDVLNLSRIEAGRITLLRQGFDFWRMLANIEEMIRVRADEKGLQFSVDRAADVPRHVSTDEGKLRQVLINLLGNAVKFTEQGEVTLRVNARSTGESECRSNGKELTVSVPPTLQHSETSRLQFEISDNGPGIPPEELPSIFEAFHQTSSVQSHEGAGLGLSISRRFVQLLGGDIQVHSTVGQGSQFTFTIQVETVEHGSVATLSPTRAVRSLASQHPPIKILVVDDHPESRRFLTLLLTNVGFKVKTAADGREALAQAQQWTPDLILMDMRMPVMDGYEATREIRRLESVEGPERFQIKNLKSQIPIIALTASAFKEEEPRILAAGCDAVLRKPISTDELFETIRTYLNLEYLYAEDAFLPENGHFAGKRAILTQDALAALPGTLVETLEQTIRKGNRKTIMPVIEEIRQRDPDLADILASLAYNFKYQTIWDMIQQMRATGGHTT